MIWNYDESWRDKFETCEHRDILIVPHATNVIGVEGGPPTVTSKVPLKNASGEAIPGEFKPVEFIITNEDIYKEKFEYTNSLDTNEDLAFCGCESAMVKFTIRNNKTYNEEKDRYELDIPNLQSYVFTPDPDDPEQANMPQVVGEVQTHYIIKVYIYFNGDSSSLIYLGMFVVEEDKVSSDGYTRDITAFDFLYQFRELDIHNWYVHLFRGINKTDNDLQSYYKNRVPGIRPDLPTTDPDYISPEEWADGWIRKPKDCWTIGGMLTDLINNLMTRYPTEKTVTNDENTTHDYTDYTQENPQEIKTNYYEDESQPYTGLALPMVLDEDLIDPSKTYTLPDTPGEDVYECYGYMPILELPVYEDPKLMDSKSLSAGKFLEDIGALAGRYPYIRLDKIFDDNYAVLSPSVYEDPTSENYHPYNLYEKCILTFKPLPKNDDPISSSNYFDNSDIVKGFKHDYNMVDTIYIWELHTRFEESVDDPTISFANLTRKQNNIKDNHPDLIKKLSVADNMFVSYLTEKEEDVTFSKRNDDTPTPDKSTVVANYKEVLKLLKEGKPGYNLQTDGDALLHDGYKKIKYRTYTPFELTTFADPVREVGDRIQIHFEDKITGETFEFPTYILSRKISGIQKMMDTYVAKGNVSSQTFSNYKTGATYAPQSMGYYGGGSSGSVRTAGGTNLTGLTANDFVEIIRNIGFRLLNEPSSVSARFVATSTKESNDNPIEIIYEEYPLQTGESDIHDGDTTNPIMIYKDSNLSSYEPKLGDYVTYWGRGGDGYEYETYTTPTYVWDGSKWVYATCNTSGEGSRHYFWNYYNNTSGFLITEVIDGTICENSSCSEITLTLGSESVGIESLYREKRENTDHYFYSIMSLPLDPGYEAVSSGTKVKMKYGDYIDETNDGALVYAFPGYWTGNYPPTGTPITVNEPPHVELKWTDPENIAEWEPKPCSWEGTIVVRKLNSPPLNRWDGVLITDSTVRDQYSENALIDDTIQVNRVYYYGIFPYYTAIQDAQHPIKYYRFTKVIRVSTGKTLDAPEILSIERIS